MPRQARLDVPGALHHIMVRGIDKCSIFRDDQDKTRFLERLGQTVSEGKCTVYAWVLMDNHVHILFKSGKDGISAVMRKLLTWYAQYFNRRHRRTGHLFENRYKSILCDEDNYLLALIRYIPRNPIRVWNDPAQGSQWISAIHARRSRPRAAAGAYGRRANQEQRR